jgi:putative endonuclease
MTDDASGQKRRALTASPRLRLGGSGARLGADWLEARGYHIIATNWRCPSGEADLIAERTGEPNFIEVNARRAGAPGAPGTPAEAVTATKRRKLIAAAQTYLMDLGVEDRAFRVDELAAQLTPAERLVEIRHYPAAVALED